MTHTDSLRLTIFKKQIEDNQLSKLEGVSNTELLKILDLAVVPNSVDLNAIKNTNMFAFLFIDKEERKQKLIKDINKIINFSLNLTKTEKTLIKFGLVVGFEGKNWKKEMFRYINTPISIKTNSQGRKIISSIKFKEIFFFIFNLVKRGKNNERLPKF
jgi:hypothetical protein